jgi:hypothetical protein
MAESNERLRIRSYRGVLDQVERRIFRIDRWRIPNPNGVSVRAVLYALGCVLAVLVASTLPLASQLLEVLPPSVRYVALPLVVAAALASWSPDGRAPHSALRSAFRFGASPRSLSGLRRAPRPGAQLAPIAAVQIASSGDHTHYPEGRVVGPAAVTLRYPAEIRLEGAKGQSRAEQLESCRRIRITEPAAGRGRAMPAGRRIEIPAGRDVVFD